MHYIVIVSDKDTGQELGQKAVSIKLDNVTRQSIAQELVDKYCQAGGCIVTEMKWDDGVYTVLNQYDIQGGDK